MTPPEGDRRRGTRHDAVDACGILAVRVRPGHGATLVNISAGGALVDTDRRLLPGSSVELQVEMNRYLSTIRGRVIRATVLRLGPRGVCYRGAICFDEVVPWLGELDTRGYLVPSHETRAGRLSRSDATPDVL